MKIVVLVATLLMFSGSAIGAVYSWVDDQGTMNFTEDLGSIPKKYRKKAKVVGGEDQEPVAEPQSQKTSVRPLATPEVQQKAASGGEETKKVLYGGKEGSAWKIDFIKMNADVKAAEDQLALLRGRLEDTSRMSRSEYLSIQMTIKNSETHLSELRKQRDALVDAANKAMVPAEFR